MNFLNLLISLLPPGCYSDAEASQVKKDLQAHANALEACQGNGTGLIDGEIFPDLTVALLPNWERTYGITPDSDMPYQSRIDNLLTAVRARGSLTREYFIALAAGLGYTITIDEFEPFMAGWHEAGDEIYIEDIVYVWQVNVQENYFIADGSFMADGGLLAGGNTKAKSYFFECGISGAGDPLQYWSDSFFELIFNRLKPAHTACVFVY